MHDVLLKIRRVIRASHRLSNASATYCGYNTIYSKAILGRQFGYIATMLNLP